MADITSGIKAYGEALFSLAEELGETEAIMRDAQALATVLKTTPEYLKMLDTPALPREERISLIDTSFA